MVKAAKIILNTETKKRKRNISKNRKKSWRKHTDIFDTEESLQQERKTERFSGCLGEKSSQQIFDLDFDMFSKESDDEKENSSSSKKEKKSKSSNNDSSKSMKLEYTIDSNTGLKATSKPKQETLIHEHRLLAGLPGAKTPYKGVSRARKQDTFEWKVANKEKTLLNPKNAQKAEIKELLSEVTTRKSRALVKQRNKRHVSNLNLWEKESVSEEAAFVKTELEHKNLTMKTKRINNRVTKPKPKKIPAVMIPDAGVSYNPKKEDHQKLIKKATGKEVKRLTDSKHERDAKTKNYPKGAEPTENAFELICDMKPENRFTPAPRAPKTSNKTEAEDLPLPKKPTERKTHKQRLKEIRFKNKQIQKVKEKKAKKQESQINVIRLREIKSQLDNRSNMLVVREANRERRAAAEAFKPPRMFIEGDVDVPLTEELHGSVREIEPSSNIVAGMVRHIYRRGLLPSHAMNRKYQRENSAPMFKKVKGKAVESFTEEDFPKVPVAELGRKKFSKKKKK